MISNLITQNQSSLTNYEETLSAKSSPSQSLSQESNMEKRAALLESNAQKFFLEQDTISEDKIIPLYKMIYDYLPEELILQKLATPDSPIRKIILLFHAFHPQIKKELNGSSKPVLFQATIEGKLYNLGIFKTVFINDYYENETDQEGLVRERLNYVLTPNVVPETFIIDLDNGKKGTFQLFLEGHKTLCESRSTLKVDPKNIRELAFAQVKKIDCDLSLLNLMVAKSGNILKFKSIDGSHILPAKLTGYRGDPLLENSTLLNPLLTPFTDEEIKSIEKIDINETCKQLHKLGIEESAIKINRCALLLLKEATKWNEDKKSRYKINLRDLLAIIYISNPYSQESSIGLLPDKKTLFYKICELKDQFDDEICHRIQLVFAEIVEIKNRCPWSNPKRKEHPTIAALKNHYTTS